MPFAMMAALAREHEAELRRHAALATLRRAHPRPRSALRERLGWVLVDLGLRLAVHPHSSETVE